MTILIIGDPDGLHSMIAMEKYRPEDITVWEDQPTHVASIKAICDRINVTNNLDSLHDMHFDVSIANPPYKGQLHLEFLKLITSKCDTIKFLHPSGWLTRTEKQIEIEVKRLIDRRVSKLTIFNGNPVFNAQFQAPLVITEIVKEHHDDIVVEYKNTGNVYKIKSIYDFPSGYWEPTTINTNLINKIKSYSNSNNLLTLRTSDINSTPLNLPTICGHPVTKYENKLFSDDFYTFFYHNSNIYTHDNNEGKFYSLNNEEERTNLVSYLKTKFARFALAINKATNRNNVSRYIKNVPLPPLDRQWNDESVNRFFNISEEEWQSIDTFIPTYYRDS